MSFWAVYPQRSRSGNGEGARADFRRALELEPTLKEAEENLRRLTTADH